MPQKFHQYPVDIFAEIEDVGKIRQDYIYSTKLGAKQHDDFLLFRILSVDNLSHFHINIFSEYTDKWDEQFNADSDRPTVLLGKVRSEVFIACFSRGDCRNPK